MAQSSKKTITTMVECGLLTAFLCVVAPWSIPIGLIPITLSTFAIYVISAVLNWKKAIVSVFLYLLLGAVGVPV
ncbi:MAG: biotin transporter BioY, partial [Clostridia bacterium]|nr:biotin transporter BioY [Clostridia bacterium]